MLDIFYYLTANHLANISCILLRLAGEPLFTVGIIRPGLNCFTNHSSSEKLLCSLYGTPVGKSKIDQLMRQERHFWGTLPRATVQMTINRLVFLLIYINCSGLFTIITRRIFQLLLLSMCPVSFDLNHRALITTIKMNHIKTIKRNKFQT